jgi:uncharacterized phage protein (TIGR01671 family)
MHDMQVRVWDKEVKRMGVPHALVLQDGQPIALYVSWHQKCMPLFASDGQSLFMLMYATGLNDKNGRRIYGGDILKECGADGRTLNEVKFGINDDDYGWYVDYIQAFTYDEEPIAGRFSRYLCLHDVAEHAEVIGNIFEHEYLIRGTSEL